MVGDCCVVLFFFFKQKSAYELRISDWSSDVCSSDLLMPNIFLHSDPTTLLGMSDRTSIDIQIAFGRSQAIPWGISESSFASMSQDRVYRYHAFGVPELGLQRGLGRDLVVAPYATALALTTRPAVAVRNLKVLEELGVIGRSEEHTSELQSLMRI